MSSEEAASALSKMLREQYGNIRAVGVRDNNMKSYDADPERFAKRITEDSLVVYTTIQPTPAQLALVEFNGFKVVWRRA